MLSLTSLLSSSTLNCMTSSTQKWTAADLPDQTGRTFVITGANSGIGLSAAKALAGRGANVVLAVRNTAKGEQAAAQIGGTTEVRQLDLADLASVRAFANDLDQDVDVLINNAGVMNIPLARTADGFELQIGTNHLGHFALTNLLLPRIGERVVVVASGAHRYGKINLDDLNSERALPAPPRLRADQARQPAVRVRAAAATDRGRLAGEGRRRPPRLGRDEPPDALRQRDRERADGGRQPLLRPGRRRWARCPRSTPPRRTSPATATSARAGWRESRGHPTLVEPQRGGQGHGDRAQAVGALRASSPVSSFPRNGLLNRQCRGHVTR